MLLCTCIVILVAEMHATCWLVSNSHNPCQDSRASRIADYWRTLYWRNICFMPRRWWTIKQTLTHPCLFSVTKRMQRTSSKGEHFLSSHAPATICLRTNVLQDAASALLRAAVLDGDATCKKEPKISCRRRCVDVLWVTSMQNLLFLMHLCAFWRCAFFVH